MCSSKIIPTYLTYRKSSNQPPGLIVKFEILHGGLIEGGLIGGSGLENNNFLHGG